MTRDEDLCWRVERALQLAWPALEELRFGDWLARFAPGVSRRSNSANPTRADLGDIEADIAACEAAYRARGAPAMFRVPALVAAGADAALARRGYAVEGESVTLYAELAREAGRDPAVRISERADAGWLAAMAALQGQTAAQAAVYRGVVSPSQSRRDSRACARTGNGPRSLSAPSRTACSAASRSSSIRAAAGRGMGGGS